MIRLLLLFAFLVVVTLSGRTCVGAEPYTEGLSGTTVKIDMVPIPGGTAEVSDPTKKGAKKKVELKPFWMSKTEVTWDAFDVYAYRLDMTEEKRVAGAQIEESRRIGLGASTYVPKEEDYPKDADAVTRPTKPYVAPDFGFGHQNYPAIGLSHLAASGFCRWLSAKTGKKYRLPTEAEWEYACLAGKPAPSKTELDKIAWYSKNSKESTHPVGKKAPNAWGLHDMIGNVSEWCMGLDGEPCVRGGSWQESATTVGPAFRDKDKDEWNASDPQMPKSLWWRVDGSFIGFRVVREE
jgi:formylglycine-generating enzyme required for sulfatase activity